MVTESIRNVIQEPILCIINHEIMKWLFRVVKLNDDTLQSTVIAILKLSI